MAITTRTNLATNPSLELNATDWAAYGGSGTAAGGQSTATAGYSGSAFYRVTWSAASTTPSGGAFYVGVNHGSPLTPGVTYTASGYVRSSKAQTMLVGFEWNTSAGAAITSVDGASIAVPANTWTRISVTAVAPTGAVNAVVHFYGGTGGVNWASGDTLDVDGVLIEASSTPGAYFDGSFVSAASVVYAWTGTANASTSTATTYQPVISVTAKTDAPCPRVVVTIQDLNPATDVVNVWRTADGKRQAVRGARRWSVVGSDTVTDYESPLGRVLAYDLEVVSGVCAQAAVPTATVTVSSATWWIQDPLMPSTAIPLNVTKKDSTAPYLAAAAVKSLEYGASVTLVPILGSPNPVALMGQRQSAGNVSFDMFTNLASVTTQLRNLIQQTSLLLIRSTGVRNDGIPGLAYFASAKPVEKPVTVAFGGSLTTWALSGDLVAAPTMNVLVPVWTYSNVQALWTTYQQAQTALGGKTYLNVLQSPTGA